MAVGITLLGCPSVRACVCLCLSEAISNWLAVDFWLIVTIFFQRYILSTTTGNVMELNKPRIISARGSDFFTNRTINVWNFLPNSVVTAPSAGCFKSRLQKFLLQIHCL